MTERISRIGEYQGYSEARYDGWRRTSEYVTVRDGVRLAVDYFRPQAGGTLHQEKLPIIWTHTRYQRSNLSGGQLLTIIDVLPDLMTLIAHGYVVAAVDVRGSGASFGSNFGWFPPEEATDAYDVTEWFAAKPWCTGKIGMYGDSYLGMTQYFCASEAPPHLACIFPEVAWLDEYSFMYPGGIFLSRPVWEWGKSVGSADRFSGLPPDWREILAADRERKLEVRPAVNTLPGEVAVEHMGGLPDSPVPPVDEDENALQLALATAEHRANPDIHAIAESIPFRDSEVPEVDGSLHDQRSIYPKLEALTRANVPAYHSGGWFDGFTQDTTHWFRNYPGPQKMVMGPWFHNGGPQLDSGVERLRWFDYWLKGIDNGIMDEAPIHYWTINAPEGCGWRSAKTWPLPEVVRIDHFFHADPSSRVASLQDGLLGSAPAAPGVNAYTVDYSTGSGIDNRWSKTTGSGTPDGPCYPDMRENDTRALTYTTPPLNADLEVTGHPVVHLWVRSSAEDGDFYVYLEEVAPGGHSAYVTEGQLRASHRKLHPAPYDNGGLPWHRSHEHDARPLVPGEPAELIFDLTATSVVFRPGHRIRVAITCADRDNFSTPVITPPPRVELLTGPEHPSRIVLPVVPHAQTG